MKTNEIYSVPVVEIIEVEVEKGYQASLGNPNIPDD